MKKEERNMIMKLTEFQALSTNIQKDLQKEGFQTTAHHGFTGVNYFSLIEIVGKGIEICVNYFLENEAFQLNTSGDILVTKTKMDNLKKISMSVQQTIVNELQKHDKTRLQILLHPEKTIQNHIEQSIKNTEEMMKERLRNYDRSVISKHDE